MGKFAVPNWSQKTLAAAAGIHMEVPAIIEDNDHFLCFMDLKDRKQYILDKSKGTFKVFE